MWFGQNYSIVAFGKEFCTIRMKIRSVLLFIFETTYRHNTGEKKRNIRWKKIDSLAQLFSLFFSLHIINTYQHLIIHTLIAIASDMEMKMWRYIILYAYMYVDKYIYFIFIQMNEWWQNKRPLISLRASSINWNNAAFPCNTN